jgi:nitrogen regulatory protein PII
MRLILAVIQPTKLRTLQDALSKIGVERMTVCDGCDFVDPASRSRSAAGAQSPRFLRRIALEIAVNEDFLDKTVETIVHVAKSGDRGQPGDGKVFVLPLEEVVRLSDVVRGAEAVS